MQIQNGLGSWAQAWGQDQRTKENPKVKEETLPCRPTPGN